MGGFEGTISVVLEPSVKYHSVILYSLNRSGKNVTEQCLVGSLSGALPS